MLISLIVAMAKNRVIGRADQLPWHLPHDLKRFRQLTFGHHLLMGRKTFTAIGRPLPGRTSLILSRDPTFRPAAGRVFCQIDAALAAARQAGETELFVCGGAEVYAQLLPRAARIYLTELQREVEGDVRMPPIPADFVLESRYIDPLEETVFSRWQRK